MSRIITFYSYKGGVGRTLALANIGLLLAKRGKRVLLMDWDLEAPGLDRYFLPHTEKGFAPDRGIVHLLHEATANSAADWRHHVKEVTVKTENVEPKTTYTLSIIPSGVASADYGQKVSSFSWASFIRERDGGPILERWRDEWKEEFDFILIDSRTGITDTGGICTVLLPDLLVLVFTANDQSFEGALGISKSAQIERRHLAVQRAPLTILPLLSRFDGRKETDLAENWLKRFDSDLKPLFDDWLPKQFQPLQIIELTKIPYVTRFSFGEPLPVITHSLTDPEFPGFYLENAARLLATDFREAAQIIDPNATIAPEITEQVRSLIQKAPIEELELRKLLRVAEEQLGESPEFSVLLDETSRALTQQSRFVDAEPLIRRALAIDEQSYGLEHPRVATRLNNLATLLQETNRLAEAEPLMRRALAIDEATYGHDHPEVATDLNNLAQILKATNQLAEAEPLMRRALEIDERTYGPEDANITTDLNNLAALLKTTNRQEQAEPLMRRALKIDERTYGPDHPRVAVHLNNLGQVLADTNQRGEAEALMGRALAIVEKFYGPKHPTVAVNLNNLAQLLMNTDRLPEAEPMMRRALAIDEQSYGPEHPSVAIRLNNLAWLLQHTNRQAEAEPLMRRAVEIFGRFRETAGHEHPYLQTSVQNYKALLQELGASEQEIEGQLTALAQRSTHHSSESRPAQRDSFDQRDL
jgi:MinD-like ATPase involved in chromosome partitioning or flagellar assembly/tetratricopeptide (TPR) repeat protein